MLRTFLILLLFLCTASAAGADLPRSMWRQAALPGHDAGSPELPPLETNPVEVQVLLSSVEMSMRLIDAYGRCREDGRGHTDCMAILRSSLDEALALIGR